jgi:hypothetical protein
MYAVALVAVVKFEASETFVPIVVFGFHAT